MNRVILIVMTLIWSLMSCVATTAEKQNEEYSDTWLKAKIVTTYALNEHLNPFTIDVDVENGVVTLTGTVRNEVERDLAGEIAKGVEGVKKVNNALEMKPEARRDAGRGSFARSVEDANITAMVKSRLLLDPNTHGMTIHVTTKNGVVILEGEVGSDMEADLARQIAQNTKGVVDVVNRLTISKDKATKE